ncbi:MAG TPA: S41 family peptidase [Chitinophagaceae bacterium]|nr:S41 family peptidase [Chitinophagaceae bacterium]
MKITTLFIAAFVLVGCSASKQSFSPNRKFSSDQLKKDYTLFREILEDAHPSLYWYTPKDSMDYYFDDGYRRINDSMTEPQFRTLLSYVIARLNCGHTSTRYSKQYSSFIERAKLRVFPVSVKIWEDTMVVAANLNRRDSILKRGTVILSINGRSQKEIVDSLSKFLASDGYNAIARYQQLSNRGNFGTWYRNVYGLSDKFTIEYLDSNGNRATTVVPVYDPTKDTGARPAPRQPQIKLTKKQIRRQQLFATRNLQIDTLMSTGFMTLSSFSRGNYLAQFFKKSFKALRKNNVRHLVIDVRSNGGGDAGLSTLLTRYLTDHSFKIGDSLYAIRRSTKYGSFIQKQWLYWLAMKFVTHKKVDGNFHFGYFERHVFDPIKLNHFDGDVYILTGGNSFSATTLFAGELKGQKNVTIVGEETGGAAYGNTAWMIPEVRLPNTGMGFRLPKFRLVINKNAPKDGHGILPDVIAGPSVSAIKNGVDYKVEKVRSMIEEKNSERAKQ